MEQTAGTQRLYDELARHRGQRALVLAREFLDDGQQFVIDAHANAGVFGAVCAHIVIFDDFRLDFNDSIVIIDDMSRTVHLSERLRVEKYGDSRYWAVYLDDDLLAVTVYKKGALAVSLLLLSKDSSLAATDTPP